MHTRSFLMIHLPDEQHYLGKFDHCCIHCEAYHWLDERLMSSSAMNPHYGLCCLQGKVTIDYVAPLPRPIYDLFVWDDGDAVKFRTHIRWYNKAFAFTSSGGLWRLDRMVFDGRGPPTYKIQGELYHQIGPLQSKEGCSPLYSQLYIYNPAEALEHRQNNNLQTWPLTMALLQHVLLCCNC